MAAGEPLSQQSSLVALTGMILAYVITKAETPVFSVTSHPVLGTRISARDKVFHGLDQQTVVEDFLKWLVERETTMTPEEYGLIADQMDDIVEEDVDVIAEQFAEGGMSEFGKAVEAARRREADGDETVLSDATEPVAGSTDKPN